MTRAEERLVIAGFHGARQPDPGCWYDMIMGATLDLSPVPAPWDPEERILRSPEALPGPDSAPPLPQQPLAAVPDWLGRPAPVEIVAPAPIRPSTVLQAADRLDGTVPMGSGTGSGAREAALAGRLIHRLLQHMPALPPAARRDAGLRFVERHGRSLAPERRGGLVDDAAAILVDPRLAALFGPGSRAEVGVAATIARDGRPPLAVTGQIDRVGETAEAVVIADFKTGTPRPLAETPPSYLAQIALYRAALQPLYPGKPVRAVLVWTSGPGVVEIDAATLDHALAAVPDR